MKGFFSLVLAAAVLASAILMSSPANAQGGPLNSILNRMERNRRTLRSLRARVTMEKWNPQTQEKEIYRGNVLYKPGVGRNVNVRLEWEEPLHELLAVSGGEYTLYRPSLNQAYKGKAGGRGPSKAGNLFAYLSMSKQEITARFETPESLGEETLWGGVRTSHIKLVPKANAGFSSKYAEIWVDEGGMPVQIKVVEKNDDASTVRLTDVERNVGIAPDQFRVQLDRRVQIIRG